MFHIFYDYTKKNTLIYKMLNIKIYMPKLILLILGLILSFSLSANEKIRGHYKLVGNKPNSCLLYTSDAADEL